MDEIHGELTKIGEELSVSGQIDSEIPQSQKQRRIFNIPVEHFFPSFRHVGAGADLQWLVIAIEGDVRQLAHLVKIHVDRDNLFVGNVCTRAWTLDQAEIFLL